MDSNEVGLPVSKHVVQILDCSEVITGDPLFMVQGWDSIGIEANLAEGQLDYDVKIEVSADGVNWHTVVEATEATTEEFWLLGKMIWVRVDVTDVTSIDSLTVNAVYLSRM